MTLEIIDNCVIKKWLGTPKGEFIDIGEIWPTL